MQRTCCAGLMYNRRLLFLCSPFAFHANVGEWNLPVTYTCHDLQVAMATHTWQKIQSSRRERCWRPAARDWLIPSRCRGDRQRL